MTAYIDLPFQRNAWYAVAEAAEATRTPMRRLALNEPLAIFRTKAGAAVVLEDRCCHRLAPLSAGRLIGDTIECPYHGLRFDAAGRCTHVPGQSDIPARARVKSYAVIERYGLVWAWMNDREDADPAKMPDWRWAEDDDWTSIQGRFRETDHANLEFIWGQTVETLNQDVDILERTQENIDLDPAARMVSIDVDKGVGRARLLARLAVKAESGE